MSNIVCGTYLDIALKSVHGFLKFLTLVMAEPKIPNFFKFLFAALSGIGATLVCYPLDLVKTQMQVLGRSSKEGQKTSLELAQHIVNSQGVRGLYVGLTASIVRQATYTGTRLGVFNSLMEYFSENGAPPGLLTKTACGMVAGTLGGIAGLPPDVALTRMAVDSLYPPEQRRNYTHVFNAFGRIVKEEGASTLFRGLDAVIVRAIVVNIAQLVSYAQAKEFLISYNIMKDNAWCHVACSVISAFVATTLVLPPDVAKTRMQNMRIVNGVPEYTGLLDVWSKVVKTDGMVGLWKGFTPLLLRNGPQFVVLFVIYENLSQMYKDSILKSQKLN